MKKLKKFESQLIIQLLEDVKKNDLAEIDRIEKSGNNPIMTKGLCVQWYESIIENVKAVSRMK